MVKINFSKVEEMLAKGMLNIEVEHLLDLATVAGKMGNIPDQIVQDQYSSPRIKILAFELDWHAKKIPDFYKKLGLSKKNIKSILEKEKVSSKEDKKMIDEIQEKLLKYKKEHQKNLPEDYEKKLVEEERYKHDRFKRFNSNEKWLPLD